MKVGWFALVGFLMINGGYLKPSQGQSNNNSDAGMHPPQANRSKTASESSNKFSIGSDDSHQDQASAKNYYKMGVKYGRARLFRQAETSFLQAIRLKSNYAEAYYGLGHVYFDLGRWQEAIAALEQVIKIDPKDDEAYAKLGEAYTRWKAQTKSIFHEDRVPAVAKAELNVSQASRSTSSIAKPKPTVQKIIVNAPTHDRGLGNVPQAPAPNNSGSQKIAVKVSSAPTSNYSTSNKAPGKASPAAASIGEKVGFKVPLAPTSTNSTSNRAPGKPSSAPASTSEKVALKVTPAPTSNYSTSNKAPGKATPAASIRERVTLKVSPALTPAPTSNNSTSNKAPGKATPAPASIRERVTLKVSPALTPAPTSNNSTSNKAPERPSPAPASIGEKVALKVSPAPTTSNNSTSNKAPGKASSPPASTSEEVALNASTAQPPSTNPPDQKTGLSISPLQASTDSTGNKASASVSSSLASDNSTTNKAPSSVSPAPELNNSTTDKVELKVSPPSDSAGSTDEKSTRKMSSTPASNNSVAKNEPNNVDLTQIYRVGIGDILDIRIPEAPSDQSSLFTVTSAGLLEHPIIARPLKVVGLTAEEISERVVSEMKNRAINENPAVSVGVREYVSHTLLVSGLVKDAGTKVLRREAIPLYVVIADAQPMPEAARAMIIARETSQALFVDLSDPRAMSLLVRPGAVITVQQNPKQFFYIGGEVKTPGEKSFRPGLKLTQSIILAGGLTRKSVEARVAREGTNGLLVVTRYKLKDINSGKLADPLIQADDRITVVH
jgi:protein involved in polysaccharide export with SLBB domain